MYSVRQQNAENVWRTDTASLVALWSPKWSYRHALEPNGSDHGQFFPNLDLASAVAVKQSQSEMQFAGHNIKAKNKSAQITLILKFQ